MFAPFACDFGKVIVGGLGLTVVPGINDAKGSYLEIIADSLVTEDCYGIGIFLFDSNTAGQARPILVDIGADPAGGTSYSVIIPDLNAACAASTSLGVIGHYYYFPLFIKAGTALAARAQVGNATAGTLSVILRVYSKPKRPELLRFGSYIDAIGIDAVNSRGTAVVPGTYPTKSAYVSLGTLPRDGWWIQTGYSVDDATMTAQTVFLDVATGDASNKRDIILEQLFVSTAAEQLSGAFTFAAESFAELPSGAELFARAAATVGADADNSAMAYVLGG